jgi:short subunit dehydrogenase-like uncharacterized protein
MGPKNLDRDYDIVLLGATGYTGALTAKHIAEHLPTNLRWVIAGRSQSKLESLLEELKGINADRTPPGKELQRLLRAVMMADDGAAGNSDRGSFV